MAKSKLVMNLGQFSSSHKKALLAALRDIAPIIKTEILKNTDKEPGGHLHDTGKMRESLEVRPVSGSNPRIEVHTVDYGVYQDRGFTHYQSGRTIKNPWISPVIFGERNNILRGIALRIKKYFDTGGKSVKI